MIANNSITKTKLERISWVLSTWSYLCFQVSSVIENVKVNIIFLIPLKISLLYSASNYSMNDSRKEQFRSFFTSSQIAQCKPTNFVLKYTKFLWIKDAENRPNFAFTDTYFIECKTRVPPFCNEIHLHIWMWAWRLHLIRGSTRTPRHIFK